MKSLYIGYFSKFLKVTHFFKNSNPKVLHPLVSPLNSIADKYQGLNWGG